MPDAAGTGNTLGDLLAMRYGEEPGAAGPANGTILGLLAHRSVRAFSAQALAPGTLETLVAAAQSAPTSSNLQAWSVVAVEDQARKQRLARLAGTPRAVEGCPLLLVFLADLSRLERLGVAKDAPMEGLRHLELFMVALIDAALAAQNAAVAAESLGLGTVYIGGMRNRPQEVAAELGLPPNCMAAFGLCVGHPDPAVPTEVKPRLPQSLVLHREGYGTAGEAEGIARYDETLAAFSQRQGMAETRWTPRMLARVGTTAALHGRDRMREVLRAMGFGLR
ncbi:MAG TPA: NADPH-dependent oxidoreductase [Roseomonas sp.]|nr:NADPH-dependent oxidoreductase [Roseomonas sp.]